MSLMFVRSAISGKTDKETKRRDSMKIQEARMTLSGANNNGNGGFDFDTGLSFQPQVIIPYPFPLIVLI